MFTLATFVLFLLTAAEGSPARRAETSGEDFEDSDAQDDSKYQSG
jgi:hypothetical protein